ncbi:hypothetical protein D3C78_1622790 [compost metagenome]
MEQVVLRDFVLFRHIVQTLAIDLEVALIVRRHPHQEGNVGLLAWSEDIGRTVQVHAVFTQ